MKNASDTGPPSLYPHLLDRKVGCDSDVSLKSVPRPVAVSRLAVPVPKGPPPWNDSVWLSFSEGGLPCPALEGAVSLSPEGRGQWWGVVGRTEGPSGQEGPHVSSFGEHAFQECMDGGGEGGPYSSP